MKYNKILIAFLTVIALFSCNRKADFPQSAFVTLDEVNISVKEDCGTLVIPVYLFNPTGEEILVSVSAIDGTAKVSDDYKILKPSNGILTFSGDVDSLAIEIAISDKYVGTITKNKKFSVKISSADVPMGAFADAAVTIRDLDHPLDKIGLFGTFEGNLIFADNAGTKVPTQLVLSAPEDDDTFEKVLIKGLEPDYASYAVEQPLEGRFDMDSQKLIIKKGQVPIEVSGYSFILAGTTDGEDETDIEFGYDETKKTLSLLTPYGSKCVESTADPTAPGNFFSIYLSGTLTKK